MLGTLSVQLVSKTSNLCDHNTPTSRTDGRTDDMHTQYPNLGEGEAIEQNSFHQFTS